MLDTSRVGRSFCVGQECGHGLGGSQRLGRVEGRHLVVGIQIGKQCFDGIELLQAAPSGFFNCFFGFFLPMLIPLAWCSSNGGFLDTP